MADLRVGIRKGATEERRNSDSGRSGVGVAVKREGGMSGEVKRGAVVREVKRIEVPVTAPSPPTNPVVAKAASRISEEIKRQIAQAKRGGTLPRTIV